jgi:hypothetical protein
MTREDLIVIAYGLLLIGGTSALMALVSSGSEMRVGGSR